jgi:hypothetical protein
MLRQPSRSVCPFSQQKVALSPSLVFPCSYRLQLLVRPEEVQLLVDRLLPNGTMLLAAPGLTKQVSCGTLVWIYSPTVWAEASLALILTSASRTVICTVHSVIAQVPIRNSFQILRDEVAEELLRKNARGGRA